MKRRNTMTERIRIDKLLDPSGELNYRGKPEKLSLQAIRNKNMMYHPSAETLRGTIAQPGDRNSPSAQSGDLFGHEWMRLMGKSFLT
jgi:hypothetical protein